MDMPARGTPLERLALARVKINGKPVALILVIIGALIGLALAIANSHR